MTIYPCSICFQEAIDGSIACDFCNNWIHFNCLGITDREIQFLNECENLNFPCPNCVNTIFLLSTLNSFEGLVKCRNNDISSDLMKLAKFSLIALKNFRPTRINCQIPIDKTANKILEQFNTKNFKAISTTGDGNCLYNSISIGLYGSEEYSVFVRVKTAIYIILNFEIISIPNTLRWLQGSLFECLVSCCTLNEWANAFLIHCCSLALSISIISIYPPINGLMDSNVSKLNRNFNYGFSPEIIILWAGGSKNQSGIWTPNHFVAVLQSNNGGNIYTEIDLTNETRSPHHIPISSPHHSPISSPHHSPISSPHHSPISSPHHSPISSPHHSPVSSPHHNTLTDVKSESGLDHRHQNSGSFSSIDAIFSKMLHIVNAAHEVPDGIKNNTSFFLINLENVKRAEHGQKRIFRDDCGSWDGKCRKLPFILTNGKLVNLKKKGDKYFRFGKEICINNQTFLQFHTYEAFLKREPNFKKRVVLVDVARNMPEDYVIKDGLYSIEYIGQMPDHTCPHGNSQNFTTEYVRTPTADFENIKKVSQEKKPKQAYVELNLNGVAVRNPHQINNCKNPGESNLLSNRSNVANDIQKILGLISCNKLPFVKQCTVKPNSPPNFIIYNDMQLDLIRKISGDLGANLIIGVDRTFNLSAMYLTITVFKLKFINSNKREAPIFFGPMFLHWNGSFETYFEFFNHLGTNLKNCENFSLIGENLTIGTDEEFALMKAISKAFPTAETILCTKHLKDGLIRNARDKFNVDKTTVSLMKAEFFNKLLFKKTSAEFSECSRHICTKYSNGDEKLGKFLSKFSDSLGKNVWNKLDDERSNYWTNNNCESLNHVMKNFLDWKVVKVSYLIQELEKLVNNQYKDLFRSFSGEGSYHLTNAFADFKVPKNLWDNLPEKKQIKHLNKALQECYKQKGGNIQKTILSSDKKFEMPLMPTIAQKIGQRKRIKSSRTPKF